jgi:ribonucleoside-diphosphate reductase alpha chain
MAEAVHLMITKRNGEVVPFDPIKVENAVKKAVKAAGKEIQQAEFESIIDDVKQEIEQRFVDFFPNVENIQDVVEKHLVKSGHYEIAKEYILYRAKRQDARSVERDQNVEKARMGRLTVKKRDGTAVLFDAKKIGGTIERLASNLPGIQPELIQKELLKNIFDGITTEEIGKALVLATISYIEKDPDYDYLSAHMFLQDLYKEVIGESVEEETFAFGYRDAFVKSIKEAVEENLLNPKMLDFDLEKLSYGLKIERDLVFKYIGIQTLYERYFIKTQEKRLELPQSFWMRVAMGLSLNEPDKEKRALEFYDVLSSLKFVNSTPTLFHAGLTHPQLSSCYLTTVKDDLSHIFKCLGDNAQLSKWSGGLGNDWSSIRGTGSWIGSTNVESQGVIPFLKIANDVTMAINRSGKRRGATCAYLETWHLDIEDFLDLRRNTGDDRRRTHDMNTANWIPDLFMKRIINEENWTLFSPDEVPELHQLYGRAFEKKYIEYEQKAENGQMRKHKTIPAKKMWRKMISRLFETGHPWITFKDPCNIRSPQDHVGVVHSSNLCTEITLNTSETETAVCNLGSVNLGIHVHEGKLDDELLSKTIKTAMRMLDNVIDLNFYPTDEAKNSNMKHRPVGLGVMGFQDALFKLDIPFASKAAVEFADRTMEKVSYNAILGSTTLAKERGAYESFKGSKWDRNLLPVDTIDLLEEERGMKIEVNRDARLDWAPVRDHIKQHGMRNSNTMAIAPTATIANISGCFPCIEPIYKNMYVKANISGEFTVVNSYLIEDLKKAELWNEEMLEQLKYYDGNVNLIPSIPQTLKDKYQEAFEIDALHCIDMTAVRTKWIDQSQSHNVFMKGTSGSKLSETYIHAWKAGLKTTYYLRSLAASQIEKSTLDAQKFGFTQKREYQEQNGAAAPPETTPELQNGHLNGAAPNEMPQNPAPPATEVSSSNVCSIMDPDCEACQ